jgi:hypothetical protein
MEAARGGVDPDAAEATTAVTCERGVRSREVDTGTVCSRNGTSAAVST